jgi:hypothetical protein
MQSYCEHVPVTHSVVDRHPCEALVPPLIGQVVPVWQTVMMLALEMTSTQQMFPAGQSALPRQVWMFDPRHSASGAHDAGTPPVQHAREGTAHDVEPHGMVPAASWLVPASDPVPVPCPVPVPVPVPVPGADPDPLPVPVPN